MHFTKWQACGNDFVFVNAMTMDIRPVVKKCVSICNRNFGIGADGIIFVLPSEKATLQMRIFNSDGSEAEMCGNGIRAFAKWAHELGLVSKHHFSVETGAGILFPELLPDGKVRVDMGVPHLNSSEIPVTGFGDGMVVNRKLTNDLHTYRITCVSMGNPHCVIFTDDIDEKKFAAHACMGTWYWCYDGLWYRNLCDCCCCNPEWTCRRRSRGYS